MDAMTTPGQVRGTVAVLLALALSLTACDSSSDEDAAPAESTTTAPAGGPTYSSKSFVVPLDVAVPDWLPSEVSADESHFLTWEPESPDEPAVRFLVPVSVFRPGDTEATPPPEDYLSYLLSLSEQGATFADTSTTTVGGDPATLVTASVDTSLDGSLGCPADGLTADACFGLQSDLALRIAVVDTGDRTLLVWLRHSGAPDTEAAHRDFEAFEQMLTTVSFRDEAPPAESTTSPSAAAATEVDGTWSTTFSQAELARSPLLYDADEVNDENWGHFTLTVGDGTFTLEQSNARTSTSVTGTVEVDQDVLRLVLPNGESFAMHFAVDGDVLTLERDDSLGVAPTPLVLEKWQRST
jgi:hypothetical protein